MYHSIEAAVRDCFGDGVSVVRSDSIPGGDINRAYRMELSSGDWIFVKTNTIHNIRFFLTESKGLKALRSAGKVGVPHVFGAGTDRQRNVSFLAMEYIRSAPRIRTYWETFGHELAKLHRAECRSFTVSGENSGKYGFSEDNYIGASPQNNHPKDTWIDFYRECRLLPQIAMAERYFDPSVRKKAGRLLDHLGDYLREPEFPSLLHGDLWSGNMICGSDGKAWIIDPAVYVGDCEADLAMMQLFGNPPESFFAAYSEIIPIDRKGYRERRKLYDLYQLLNHLNLFGQMYLSSVVGIIEWYI